jgi:hypothetical protein
MQGMILAAVTALILEKCIAETIIVRRLGVGARHLPLMSKIGKTAVISVVAGIVTYIVYNTTNEYLLGVGESIATSFFSTMKLSTLNFIGGGFVMLVCGSVYAPIYLIGASLWGVIEDGEKQTVRDVLKWMTPKRGVEPIVETRG